MNFKLVGDKILVKYLPPEEKQVGLLLIQENEQREHKAVVIEVGTVRYVNGVKEPFDVVKDDVVLMTSKNPIFLDNKYVDENDLGGKYRIVESSEIIAILGKYDATKIVEEVKFFDISVVDKPFPEFASNVTGKKRSKK